ncbi:MAG: hypothetical protein SFY32_16440 [Bacteroidota bacterium]|nr:hypothetical protein [Bacteroidota bacterium]
MKNEVMEIEKEQLINLFQVEELEERLEFGWITAAEPSVTVSPDGSVTGSVKLTF